MQAGALCLPAASHCMREVEIFYQIVNAAPCKYLHIVHLQVLAGRLFMVLQFPKRFATICAAIVVKWGSNSRLERLDGVE